MRDATVLVDDAGILDYRINSKYTYVNNGHNVLAKKDHAKLKETDDVYLSLRQMWIFATIVAVITK